MRVVLRCAAELLAACVLATLASLGTLALVDRTSFDLPSHLPLTVASTLLALLVLLTTWLLLRRRPLGPRALWCTGVVIPSVLATTHLGFLLYGTPHYLNGLAGDQLNRVPALGRYADSAALSDVYYADAAPFYPPGWFWIGGRLAALGGFEPWSFYKTFAIATMATSGALAFVVWRWAVAPRLAAVLALVTTIVGLHLGAYSPYSWVLIAVLPVVILGVVRLSWELSSGGGPGASGAGLRGGPWPVTVGTGLFLGWCALSYTLIAGFGAAIAGVLLLTAAWRSRRRDPGAAVRMVGHLAAMAAISIACALVFWHRHLLAALGGAPMDTSVANDFAPESANAWPLPMLEATALGALCLLGTAWLAFRLRIPRPGDPDEADRPVDPVAVALAVLSLATLVWFALSGLRALTGTTLLPFRMIPVLTLALALAGVYAAVAVVDRTLALAADGASRDAPGLGRIRGGQIKAVAVVLGILCAIQLTQYVPEEDRELAATARGWSTPTPELLGALDRMIPPEEASRHVVLSDDSTVLAHRPYFSFEAPAQAYASPAGRYEDRLAEIARWASASTPDELVELLDSGPFRPPDVFVFEAVEAGTPAEAYEFTRMLNVMPRAHNNVPAPVTFDPALFADDDLFEVHTVGDRVVIERLRG